MKTPYSLFLCSLMITFALTPAASAGTRVSFVGALTGSSVSKARLSGIDYKSDESNIGYGTGILAEFMIVSNVGFELGALYLRRNIKMHYTLSSVTTTYDIKTQTLQFPALFKLWLTPYFSIGLGGYYNKGIGNLKYTTTVGSASSTETSSSYSSFGVTTQEYGFAASLGGAIPLSNTIAFILDGRYYYGLASSASRSSDSFKVSDAQLLLGLRFGSGK